MPFEVIETEQSNSGQFESEGHIETCPAGLELAVETIPDVKDLLRIMGNDYRPCGIDSCNIADIVKALNKNGIETRACCCGFIKLEGIILLTDGRTLKITMDR